jgi:hypothetical protein
MVKSKEQLLEDEIRYAFPEQSFSGKQFDTLMQEQRDVYLIPREKMTFVIAHTLYNEEQYMEECLYDDLKMNDVDIIHILDGAWKNYPNGTAKSTDKTIEIIEKFKEEVGDRVEVVYESKDLWNNQGEKRNYQLDRIHDIVKNPYYILVKDADEFFHFPSGKQNMWLKRDMVEWQKTQNDVGIINTHAWYFDNDMWGARLFPSTNRVHYFTKRSMVVHDTNHNIVMDYNPNTLSLDKNRIFKFNSFMFINKWNLRNKERVHAKAKYMSKYKDVEHKECEYE